jgi:hypothetical protein
LGFNDSIISEWIWWCFVNSFSANFNF